MGAPEAPPGIGDCGSEKENLNVFNRALATEREPAKMRNGTSEHVSSNPPRIGPTCNSLRAHLKKSGDKHTTLVTEGPGSSNGSPEGSGRPSALKKADPLESISIISMKSSRNIQQEPKSSKKREESEKSEKASDQKKQEKTDKEEKPVKKQKHEKRAKHEKREGRAKLVRPQDGLKAVASAISSQCIHKMLR